MKKILNIIPFLLLSIFVFGQQLQQPIASIQSVQTLTTTTFNATVNGFQNYDIADFDFTNDTIYVAFENTAAATYNTTIYRVTNITGVIGQTGTFTVVPVRGSSMLVFPTVGVIWHKPSHTTYDWNLMDGKSPFNLVVGQLNHNVILLDSILGSNTPLSTGTVISASENIIVGDSLNTVQQLIDLMQDSIPIDTAIYNVNFPADVSSVIPIVGRAVFVNYTGEIRYCNGTNCNTVLQLPNGTRAKNSISVVGATLTPDNTATCYNIDDAGTITINNPTSSHGERSRYLFRVLNTSASPNTINLGTSYYDNVGNQINTINVAGNAETVLEFEQVNGVFVLQSSVGSGVPTVAGTVISSSENMIVGDSIITVDQLDRYIAQPDYFTIATEHTFEVGDCIHYNSSGVAHSAYDSTYTGGVIDSFPQAVIQRIVSGASFDTIYAVTKGQVAVSGITASDKGKWVIMGKDGKIKIPVSAADSIKVGYVNADGLVQVGIDGYSNLNGDASSQNELSEWTESGAAPTTTKQGDMWLKTPTDSVFIYDAGNWTYLVSRSRVVNYGITDTASISAPKAGDVTTQPTYTFTHSQGTFTSKNISLRYNGTSWARNIKQTITRTLSNRDSLNEILTLSPLLEGDIIIANNVYGQNDVQFEVQSGVPVRLSPYIIECVVRLNAADSLWTVLDDVGHAPSGLSSSNPITSTKTGNGFTLNYATTATRILTASSDLDESYAKLDMDVGLSVGFSTATASISVFNQPSFRATWNGSAWTTTSQSLLYRGDYSVLSGGTARFDVEFGGNIAVSNSEYANLSVIPFSAKVATGFGLLPGIYRFLVRDFTGNLNLANGDSFLFAYNSVTYPTNAQLEFINTVSFPNIWIRITYK